MLPNPKIVRAYKVMRAIGIIEDRVKPVLKRLVKVYDKNWEFIDDDEYRALVDAIFEEEAAQGSRTVAGAGELTDPHVVGRSLAPFSLSPQQRYAYKGKQPLVPQVAPKETGHVPFMALVPKDEPFTDDITSSPSFSVASSFFRENRANCEASAANLEIARMGGVKIYVTCNSMVGGPTFHMPRQQELLKSVEEKYLPSDPNFSVRKVLKDICECVLELAAD
ncbi:hypothetical protein Tsubulata_025620 [Turnera subulata]|uniref:WIYLD domain-containing protein n=1 Tax=Turnera subulata TaxID=218843 RepID=A0A9Q0J2E9_9ROSI|nr:hypothetical protein Tsubulata_025620 [Turnera subulata]